MDLWIKKEGKEKEGAGWKDEAGCWWKGGRGEGAVQKPKFACCGKWAGNRNGEKQSCALAFSERGAAPGAGVAGALC